MGLFFGRSPEWRRCDQSSSLIVSIDTSLSIEFRDKRQRDTENEDQDCCSICGHQTKLGLSCSDHFICAQHLRSHKGIEIGESPLKCMIEGCSKCYREGDVQNWLPAAIYRDYIILDGMNKNYCQLFVEMNKNIHLLEGKIDVLLDGIRDLQRSSDRAGAALASRLFAKSQFTSFRIFGK